MSIMIASIRSLGRAWFARLGLLLILAAAITAGSMGGASATQAAGARQAAPTAPRAAFGGECSDGTPGLAPLTLSGARYLFVAWIGCDSAHHLNIEGTRDGVNWGSGACGGVCAKQTLNEAGFFGSGVALVEFNRRLYVAWPGTNSAHSLNVASYIPGNSGQNVAGKVTLSDSTNFNPALAANPGGDGALYLAWTGTDTSHHLNIMRTFDGISFANKTTLTDTAAAGPGLAAWNHAPEGNHLRIAWRGTDSIHRIYTGYYTLNQTTLGNHTGLTALGGPVTTTGDVGLTVQGNDGHLYLGFVSNDLAELDKGITSGVVVAYTTDGKSFTYGVPAYYVPVNTLGTTITWPGAGFGPSGSLSQYLYLGYEGPSGDWWVRNSPNNF